MDVSRDGQLILQRASILDVAQGSKYIQALPHIPTMRASIHSLTGLETLPLWGRAGEIKADGKTKGLLGICLSKPFL